MIFRISSWFKEGMETTMMEKYAKAIKRRTGLLAAAAILFVSLLAVGVATGILAPDDSRPHFGDYLAGFETGLMSCMSVIFIMLAIKFGRLLKKPDALRQQYIKEHDERTQLIWAKSGGTLMYVCAIALILAGIVSGYFSAAAFHSLVGAAMFLLLSKTAVALYYKT